METKQTNFSLPHLASTPAPSEAPPKPKPTPSRASMGPSPAPPAPKSAQKRLNTKHRPSLSRDLQAGGGIAAMLPLPGPAKAGPAAVAFTPPPPLLVAPDSSEERVKVFVRVRPTHPHETPNALQLASDKRTLVLQRDRHSSQALSEFTVDGVLPSTATQADVYDAVAKPAVKDFLKGFNATLLAYGQTGAGKTHTLGSIEPNAVGIIPRAISEIFTAVGADQVHSYTVSMSYLQIYCEQIQDLLCPESGDNLPIREGASGVYVAGLTSVEVASLEECLQLLQLGTRNRTVAFTALNATSSRSHAVVILTAAKRLPAGVAGPATTKVGKLFMVDLAGSERLKKSKSTGQRASEAKAINLSLTTLGMCVSARASGVATHIPFRDSKLTRLLQESLGGNAKTSMVVAVCDAAEHAEETLQSLQFGSRAMRVVTQARVNEEVEGEEQEVVSPMGAKTAALMQSLLEKETELETMQAQLQAHQEQGRQVVAALQKERQEAEALAAELTARHEEALTAQHAHREALLKKTQEVEARATEAERRWVQEKGQLEKEVASLRADALRSAKEADAALALLQIERQAMKGEVSAAKEAAEREWEQRAAVLAARQRDEANAACQSWEREREALKERHSEALQELEQEWQQRAAAVGSKAEASWQKERQALQRAHDAGLQTVQREWETKIAIMEASHRKEAGEITADIAATRRRWEADKKEMEERHAREMHIISKKEREVAAAVAVERQKRREMQLRLEGAVAEAQAQQEATAASLKQSEASWSKQRQALVERAERQAADGQRELAVKSTEIAQLRAAAKRGQQEVLQLRSAVSNLEKQMADKEEAAQRMRQRIKELEATASADREAAAKAVATAQAAKTRTAATERAYARLQASLRRDQHLNVAATVIQRAFRAYRVRSLQRQRSQGYAALSEAQYALGSLAQQHADMEARRHSNLSLTGQTLVAESLSSVQEMVEGLVATFLLPTKDLKAVERLRQKAPAFPSGGLPAAAMAGQGGGKIPAFRAAQETGRGRGTPQSSQQSGQSAAAPPPPPPAVFTITTRGHNMMSTVRT